MARQIGRGEALVKSVSWSQGLSRIDMCSGFSGSESFPCPPVGLAFCALLNPSQAMTRTERYASWSKIQPANLSCSGIATACLGKCILLYGAGHSDNESIMPNMKPETSGQSETSAQSEPKGLCEMEYSDQLCDKVDSAIDTKGLCEPSRQTILPGSLEAWSIEANRHREHIRNQQQIIENQRIEDERKLAFQRRRKDLEAWLQDVNINSIELVYKNRNPQPTEKNRDDGDRDRENDPRKRGPPRHRSYKAANKETLEMEATRLRNPQHEREPYHFLFPICLANTKPVVVQ